MTTSRAYAPAQIVCGCGEVVEMQIPVDYELHVNEKGQDAIRAAVAQADDFTEPMWRHAFEKHGPRLD